MLVFIQRLKTWITGSMKSLRQFVLGFRPSVNWFIATSAVSLTLVGNLTASEVQTPSELSVPIFQEQANEAGVDHQYTGEWEFFVGGGGAAFDCDGNRLPDVFFAGGSSAAQLFRNTSLPGGELRFKSVELNLSVAEKTDIVGAYRSSSASNWKKLATAWRWRLRFLSSKWAF